MGDQQTVAAFAESKKN